MDNSKLDECRKAAQKKYEMILDLMLHSHSCLVHLLVKAYREGHNSDNALLVLEDLEATAREARLTYVAAIAQPAPKLQRSKLRL